MPPATPRVTHLPSATRREQPGAAAAGGAYGWPRLLGATAAGMAALAVVAVRDPNTAGHYPTCPFLAVTGWYCPGCGALRAVHALTHGDLSAAVGFNPLLVAVLPVLAGLYLGLVRRTVTGRPRSRAAPGWLVWAFLLVVLAFGVLRNLPAGAWLAP